MQVDTSFLQILLKKAIFEWVMMGNIWATSWQNLFMPYANNEGADQPAHLRSLISIFFAA